jgi:hypothetical protein
LCRKRFDPELGEEITEFNLSTTEDFAAYIRRRERLTRSGRV